ncbi:putative Caulimovirus viroplasmin RNase H [Trypanosoma vivax]|uniref:ribonuclease H n=1 Tax=Trypanosoma vivax (strain Y486) TaxID=1055687 RepID=G0TYX0_TRYVY|nr:putative ribonuclease H1 [Trypanosoma vivax]KAH8613062.1 putative Caulimovirus viroplasmin RNase H [Trypanosoma vivax]CCC49173.1 putative ribonuclease H1 [Trypanosoma vivax Y486]
MKSKYYAVAVGRKVGVFRTWEECQQQVSGFSGARHKSFSTLEDAERFVESAQSSTSACEVVQQGLAAPLGNEVSARQAPICHRAVRPRYSDGTLDDMLEGIDEENQEKLSREWFEARLHEAVVVYIDGACSNNGSQTESNPPLAGYGGFYGDDDPRNFKFPVPANEPQTNQRAELSALVHVLRTAVATSPCSNLCVYSDSIYIVKGAITYLRRWEHNDFKTAANTTVANVDLWKEFSALRAQHLSLYASRLIKDFRFRPVLATTVARKIAMQLRHIKAHSGVYGNEMADRLAVEGRKMER